MGVKSVKSSQFGYKKLIFVLPGNVQDDSREYCLDYYGALILQFESFYNGESLFVKHFLGEIYRNGNDYNDDYNKFRALRYNLLRR